MPEWLIESTDGFELAHKHYEKKHPNELAAVLNNLDKYFKALANGAHSQFIVAGYIHNEQKGVKALDQSGSKSGKLKQTRLYVYADEINKKLYLITIGDKNLQKEDIKYCSEFVASLK